MLFACTSVVKKREMAKRERKREKIMTSRKQIDGWTILFVDRI